MSGRGRLVVFEGGEGSGKSTQAALLAQHLGALLTREPGGTLLGERLREVYLDPAVGEVSARAELLVVNAARAQHVSERILPALESGRDVVCDRFIGSTIAYQGYGRGLPLEDVLVACELATAGVQADLTILLDVDPELGRRRREGAARDRIEAEDAAFHARVVEGFRELAAADPKRWVRVEGSGTVEEVEKEVLAALGERLGVQP